MLRLALALILLASPALAEVTAENPTLLSSGMVRLTLHSDAPVILTAAALIDSQGRTFEISESPRGIKAGPSASCQLSAPVAGTVYIPFKPSGEPPYSLSLEFETPDRAQQFGCRSQVLTLDDLR